MNYVKIVLLILALLAGKVSEGLANPLPSPVIISEFSTDEDWIEVYGFPSDFLSDFRVNGQIVHVTEIPDQMDYYWEQFFVFTQLNTTGFDLVDDYGSIYFYYSKEVRYGTWGPVPAPPPNETTAFYFDNINSFRFHNDHERYSISTIPTPGTENNILMPAYGSSSVVINEIFPDSPGDNVAFVELFNKGVSTIDIGGWSIISGVRFVIPFGTVLAPESFWILNEYEFPEGFQLHDHEGSMCIQKADGIMIEKVGWSARKNGDHSFIRFPDGYSTHYQSFTSETAVDFRESIPTPGEPNHSLYAIDSITLERDSLFIDIGDNYILHCSATDSNGDTFRIHPNWRFEGDFASIDEGGIINVTNPGNGQVYAEIDSFQSTAYVFGVLAGKVSGSMILKAEASPYWIHDMSIEEGGSLTIEPGTTIIMIDDYNMSTSFGTLRSFGTICLAGTSDKPINFIGWGSNKHIQLRTHSNDIQNCIFDNIRVESNANKDAPDAEEFTLQKCLFYVNKTGGFIVLGGIVRIKQCCIIGKSDIGYGIELTNSPAFLTIENNYIANLPHGILIYRNGNIHDVINVLNNCITNCEKGISIENWIDGLQIHHNNIWATDTPYSGDTGNLGIISTQNANGTPSDAYYNISADPLFVNPEAGDFRLMAGSPCINAGDTAIRDADGSAADIGYLTGAPVGVREPDGLPSELALHQNMPNPFNASTTIAFNLPESGRAMLTVYSVTGQKVATLVDEYLAAGNHRAVLDGGSISSGVYITRLVAGNRALTGKMLLVK